MLQLALANLDAERISYFRSAVKPFAKKFPLSLGRAGIDGVCGRSAVSAVLQNHLAAGKAGSSHSGDRPGIQGQRPAAMEKFIRIPQKNAARFAPFTIGLKGYRINTVVMHKAALQKLLTYMDRMGAIASGTGTG